ncbi:MAG TPA: response regulator [Desulfohalobiaceae bacterium]|nr:response regulator [Desulfohalobiaceae bacterium]
MAGVISILVVDDDQQFALNMSRLLRNRNYQVVVAFNGNEALEIIQGSQHVDVVVLDIKMPGMDGLTCLGEMKRYKSELEVIMLTGHASLQSGVEAIRAGAFDYLMKPCEVESLTAKINEAYRLKSIRQNPILWPRQLVKEVYSPHFLRLRPEDPIIRAFDIISKGRVEKETLHVSDSNEIYQGTISKSDILEETMTLYPNKKWTWSDLLEKPEFIPDKQVSEVMKTLSVPVCSLNEKLTKVADRMIANKARCLPVVEEKRLVGIIQLKDVLRYLEHVEDDRTIENNNGSRT